MAPIKLTYDEIAEKITSLNENLDEDFKWQLKERKLYKEFKFKSFVAAFAWMTKIAKVAEKEAHHPEWFNVYNRVQVSLCTHDCDGMSQKDFDMAKSMEKLV